jgi:hypothetical protein
MLEEKSKLAIQPEVIALPPLRMALMHANDEHVSKAALTAAVKKISLRSMPLGKGVDSQVVRKLIEYLEKSCS